MSSLADIRIVPRQPRYPHSEPTVQQHCRHCIVAPACTCIVLRERFAYCALTHHISITIYRFLNPGLPCALQGFRDNSFQWVPPAVGDPLIEDLHVPISRLHPQRSLTTSTRAVWFPLSSQPNPTGRSHADRPSIVDRRHKCEKSVVPRRTRPTVHWPLAS